MWTTLLQADATVRVWLTAWHRPWLDALMAAVSGIGRGGLVWLAVGVLLTLRRRLRLAALWQLVLALVLAFVVSDGILKPLVNRPRPFAAHPMTVRIVGSIPGGGSFPSGHAAAAFAAAFVLAQYWPGSGLIFWPLAALIAGSRIYVGAHYPLDVLVGALLGCAIGWLVVGRSAPVLRGRMPADEGGSPAG